MKIALYQKAVTRTLPDLGSLGANLAHMGLGMSSELSELQECHNNKPIDRVHCGEECGDSFWYGGGWANIRGIRIPDDIFDNLEEGCELTDIALYGGMLSDIAKRLFAYKQPPEAREEKRRKDHGDKFMTEEEMLFAYMKAIGRVVKFLGLNIEVVMGQNIMKLFVRYKDKYTDDEALCRDLEAERVELEKIVA